MELRNGDNSILSRMQGNFPHIYDVYNDKTILYAILSIYASKYNMTRDIIDRIYGMIGIETTYDEDLEHRWGSMLGIYKEIGESYDDYRARLMIVYASFSGGTAEAIKYAVAVTVGISTEKSVIDKYINIIDAWEYDHELIPHDTDPKYDAITNNTNCLTNTGFVLNKPYDAHKDGAFVCTIDLSINESIHYYKDKIMTAINKTKASGINAYLAFLYISNEIADVVRHSDTETMVIRESREDEGIIPAHERPMYPSTNNIYRLLNRSFTLNERLSNLDYKVEQIIDNIVIKPVVEDCNIGRVKSKVWHHGYGDTNTSMITNEYEDTDFVYDRVLLNTVLEIGNTSSDDRTLDKIGTLDVEQQFIVGTKNTFNAVTNNIHSLLNSSMQLSKEIHVAEVDEQVSDIIGYKSNDTGSITSKKSTTWDNRGDTNTTMITDKMSDTDSIDEVITESTSETSNVGHTDRCVDNVVTKVESDNTGIVSSKNTFMLLTNGHGVLNSSFVVSDPTGITEVDDKLVDIVQHTIQEVSKMRCIYSSEWSRDGLNASTVLNKNFMTNMLAEADAFSDIIIKGGIRYAVQG